MIVSGRTSALSMVSYLDVDGLGLGLGNSESTFDIFTPLLFSFIYGLLIGRKCLCGRLGSLYKVFENTGRKWFRLNISADE